MRQVFRPWFGRVLTVAIATVCAVALVVFTIQEGVSGLLRTGPWLALVAGSCWALFWHPEVVVDDGGVRLVNVLRTIDLPWPSIQAIDTKWALKLVTAYGRYTAWAAPAPGLHEAARATRQDAEHLPESTYAGGSIRPGDLPISPSGTAALLIRRRWQALRDAGHLDNPRLERERASVTWHWGIIGAGAVLAVIAALGLLL